MTVFDPDLARSRAIRPQVIGDYPIGNEAVLLQQFAHQFQRRTLVSPGLNKHVENFAFGIDCAPKINHSTVNLQIDLVKMPCRMGPCAPLAQVRGNYRSEMIQLSDDADLATFDEVWEIVRDRFYDPRLRP